MNRMYQVTNSTDGRWLASRHIFVGETRVVTKRNIEDSPNYGYEKQNTYYYHGDHLGSAQLVTDPSGNEYERTEYTPYGELWIEQAGGGLPAAGGDKYVHSATLRAWWHITQFCGKKIAPAGLSAGNCQGQLPAPGIASRQFRGLMLSCRSDDKTPFRFTGKELDQETGFYYFGARYLDPKTSVWISADPAMGDYVPRAPIDDEAKKHNGNLPGMGGVYNYVNMHVYHYAGNNPVKLVDPDGKITAVILGNARFHRDLNKLKKQWGAEHLASRGLIVPQWNPTEKAESNDLVNSDTYVATEAKVFSEITLKVEPGSEKQKEYVAQEQNLYKRVQSYRSQNELNIIATDKFLEAAKDVAEKEFRKSRKEGFNVQESIERGERAGNKYLSDTLAVLEKFNQ
jgi:RHS repeat-associated protein